MADTASNTPYLLFTLALSVVALGILGASVVFPLEPGVRQILDFADDGLCALFFADFLVTLKRSPNKWEYFFKWGWIDLLSCVPYVDYLRTGRVARILRIFRILRAIRSAKIIADTILRKRSQSVVLASTLMGFLLIILSSIGILEFEDVPGSNIKDAEDAVWWTMETITTVGYGDKFPITTEGRILAAAVMLAGVALVAIYTAAMAAWFLEPKKEKEDRAGTLAQTLRAIEGMNASERYIIDTILNRGRDS